MVDDPWPVVAVAVCPVAWLDVVAGNGQLGIAEVTMLVEGKAEGRIENTGMEGHVQGMIVRPAVTGKRVKEKGGGTGDKGGENTRGDTT